MALRGLKRKKDGLADEVSFPWFGTLFGLPNSMSDTNSFKLMPDLAHYETKTPAKGSKAYHTETLG